MSYFDGEDLKNFSKVGDFASSLAEKFFSYYNAATGEDGALTKREKALIGLAVAHSKQCPYCIEAYTESCLQNGADPEQMTEAVHVSAALSAGVDLVHATQMQKHLKKNGAI